MMTSQDRTMACDSQDQPVPIFLDFHEFWEGDIMMMISKLLKRTTVSFHINTYI